MTPVQRTVHAWVWVVLGPLVLIGVVVAIWQRQPRDESRGLGAGERYSEVETAGGGR